MKQIEKLLQLLMFLMPKQHQILKKVVTEQINLKLSQLLEEMLLLIILVTPMVRINQLVMKQRVIQLLEVLEKMLLRDVHHQIVVLRKQMVP